MEAYFKLALANIANHGDTDIFPYPVENAIFYDSPAEAREVLEEMHRSFDRWMAESPPVVERALAAVGYTGFRWASQIEPMWNAYLLALVLSMGDDIERARIESARQIVFSYRFAPDRESARLFDVAGSWRAFQARCNELAASCHTVLCCDIADFYPRIYHHRLENALSRASGNSEAIRRVRDLLGKLSNNVSYGLPVGGPAARLLSELLLNSIDRLLHSKGVAFCRYADDYRIFVKSREEAYARLVLLSEALLQNEGLTLQKHKTRVMSAEEYLGTNAPDEELERSNPLVESTRRFMTLRVHFDPYSATASADYQRLQAELSQFDVVGMLGAEIEKTRVDTALSRRLLGALRVLPAEAKAAAVDAVIDSLPVLYPVFPNVMMFLRGSLGELDAGRVTGVYRAIRTVVASGSHMTQVPVNLAYAIRVLADDPADETEQALVAIYENTRYEFIKRDVIVIMTHRRSHYWLSHVRQRYNTMGVWERRALLLASFVLGDEGGHWRKAVGPSLTPMDKLIIKWAATRKQANKWTLPL